MSHPSTKKIGRLTISVDYNGWPRWTRIDIGNESVALNEEEAQDLHYVMTRIVAFLEDQKVIDRLRGVVA